MSASASKLALPIVQWTMPALSARYRTWPAFAFLHRAGDVRRHRADLRVRHQAARAEDLAELTDDAHRIRARDHDVEIELAGLHLLGEVFQADDVGAGGFAPLGILAAR